jgi:hypothetical protein
VDNDADASGDFVLIWDNVGFYFGSWLTDDIHNAQMCKFLETANDAYQDDAHEIYLNVSYSDAVGGGTLGSQDVLGLNEEGILYAGLWGASGLNGGPPVGTWGNCNLTIEQFRTQYGWDANYSSSDGVNFTVESMWTWSGSFLQKIGTKAVGTDVGFDVSLCDNDGAVGAADGVLQWSGLPNSNAQHWCQITLADDDSPIKTNIVARDNMKTSNAAASYDLLGRRINSRTMANYKGVVFTIDKTTNNAKQIVLR